MMNMIDERSFDFEEICYGVSLRGDPDNCTLENIKMSRGDPKGILCVFYSVYPLNK